MTYPRSGCHPSALLSRQSFQACLGMGGYAGKRLGARGGQVGVQTSLERKQGSANKGPNFLSLAPGSLGSRSAGSRGSRSYQQGCSRAGTQPKHTRVLRTTVCRSQIHRGMETGVRSVGPKPLPEGVSIQNGDRHFNSGCYQATRLGRLVRPYRCVLPRADSPSRSEVPEVCMAGQGLSVHSCAIRPCSSPLALHQDYSRTLSRGEESGDTSSRIPRRLVAVSLLGGTLPTPHANRGTEVSKSGLCVKRKEVRSDTESGIHLLRHGNQYQKLDGCAVSSASCTSGRNSEPPLGSSDCAGQDVGLPPRINRVDGSAPPFRSSTQETGPKTFHGVSGLPKLVADDSTGLSFSGGGITVARPVMAVTGSSHCPPPAAGVSLHRCFSEGMGGPHGKPGCVGSLEFANGRQTHKPTGARGSGNGPESISSCPEGQACSVEHRQHYSSMLSQQAGGSSFPLSLYESRADSALVPGETNLLDGQVHSRKAKYLGGRAQQVAHDASDGMDHSPSGPNPSVEPLVQTRCRFICYKVQQTPSHLCISGPGSPGLGGGRSESAVGSSSVLCLSSSSHSRESLKKSKRRTGDAHSDSPSVGGPALVPRPSESYSRRTSSSGSRAKVSRSTSDRGSAQKSSSTKPSRLVSVRDSLSARGATPEVIELIEHAHRPGTKKLYDSRWAMWHQWCSRNKVDPVKPESMQFARYLAFLSSTKKLSASAVKGHRASISTTIKQLGGRGFSESHLLKLVVQGATLKEARTPRHFPAWDLRLVLESLRSDPYEHISSCKLSNLTHKTVFLISLASGRRCSEIHALSYNGLAWESDGSASLKFTPGFLAKNQPPDVPSPPVFIKALAPLLCPDDLDKLLCPIRCLKMYVKRTRHLRSHNKKRLFVSPLEGKHSDITVASISRWIKNTIREAYSKTDAIPDNVKAHEVRAWASSLAWAHNTSLKDIMEAAYWFGRPTFFQFYLRDVSHTNMDGSHGISLVAAQQILRK